MTSSERDHSKASGLGTTGCSELSAALESGTLGLHLESDHAGLLRITAGAPVDFKAVNVSVLHCCHLECTSCELAECIYEVLFLAIHLLCGTVIIIILQNY